MPLWRARGGLRRLTEAGRCSDSRFMRPTMKRAVLAVAAISARRVRSVIATVRIAGIATIYANPGAPVWIVGRYGADPDGEDWICNDTPMTLAETLALVPLMPDPTGRQAVAPVGAYVRAVRTTSTRRARASTAVRRRRGSTRSSRRCTRRAIRTNSRWRCGARMG